MSILLNKISMYGVTFETRTSTGRQIVEKFPRSKTQCIHLVFETKKIASSKKRRTESLLFLSTEINLTTISDEGLHK
jgi:hypothetical protein